jgi:hypothetical protein
MFSNALSISEKKSAVSSRRSAEKETKRMCYKKFAWTFFIFVLTVFLFSACKNSSVYFSTGTTVGLEGTPPGTDMPPTVTLGYKRMELAMVPVAKLNSQKQKQQMGINKENKGGDLTTEEDLDTNVAVPVMSGRGCKIPRRETHIDVPIKNTSKLMDPSIETGDAVTQTKSNARVGADGEKNVPIVGEDAFSVLAVFNLAVNWFGPTKVEQHFATGCAATYLLGGLTEAEEDSRRTEQARKVTVSAKLLLNSTRKDVDRLQKGAIDLEKTATATKAAIENALIDASKKNTDSKPIDQEIKKAEQGGEEAQKTLERAAGWRLKADKHTRQLKEAEEKAKDAIELATQAMRSEEVRESAQKAKEEAQQVLDESKEIGPIIKQQISDAVSRIDGISALAAETKRKSAEIKSSTEPSRK